jgi:polyisoprenoid-binding protein YceI
MRLRSIAHDEPAARGSKTHVVPQGIWRVAAERSRIGFKVRKMGLYFVKGRFKRINGCVELGADGVPIGGWLRIDASSVSTRIPPRDWHLRTRDFLAVKQYPEIRFDVERVEHARGGAMAVLAVLAICGGETRVPLTAHWHVSERGGSGGAVLHVSGTVDRHELGLRPRRPVDWIVGRQVHLDAVLHLEPIR